jgi:hypothetical protein
VNNKQLERLNDNYFSKYSPCPLKLRCGEEILVYPTLVEDGDDYYKCINLFNFEKDKLIKIKELDTDEQRKMKIQAMIELQQMSYLEFLIRIVFPQDLELLNNLARLIQIVLKENYVYCYNDKCQPYLDDNGKPCICVGNDKGELKYYINKTDFENLKQIILNQNNADYDNREMSDDVKEIVEMYYKAKIGDTTPPNFEKQKIYVMVKMQYTYKELKQLPLRMFLQIYNMCFDVETNLINNILKSGFQATEMELKHPLYQPKRDFIAEAFTSKNTIDKIKNSLH